VRGQVISKADFRGGVNLEAAPYFLSETEARDLRNVVSNVRGAIRKRDGAQTLATVGATLTSLFAALTPDLLVAAGGTVLYSITPGGAVATIKTGMTNGARWSFVQAPASGGQGPIYGVNGTDAQQWDGVAASTSAWTAATGTFPAGAKYLLYQGRRVFAAGMAAYAGVPDPGSTVVASNLGDPRDWPADKVVQFDPGDGEQITAIGSVGPYVLVAKPSKLWLIYDLDTLANRPLGKNVGCVANRSMVETPFGTFFLGKDAVYKTDGSDVKGITQGRLTPLVTALPAGARSVAAGGWWNGHYYLSLPTAGAVNDLTVDYDVAHDSFWLHTLAEAQWATWEQGGQSVLYGAKPDASKIVDRAFVAGEVQDNGAPFTAYWKSPFYTFGDVVRRKRIRLIHFDGKGRIQASAAKTFSKVSAQLADVDFALLEGSYGVNDGTSYTINDGSIYGGISDVGEARILTPGVARAWSVIVANQHAETFEVESINFALTGRKD
jgi:hypothetical protein